MEYDKNTFKLEWYSGQGAGGQHRNKHQNCCRLTHLLTGLRVQATESRERSANQRKAFERLDALIKANNFVGKERRYHTKTIRNYHAVRNEVHDKASGLKMQYKDVVLDYDIGPMIDARRIAMGSSLGEDNEQT